MNKENSTNRLVKIDTTKKVDIEGIYNRLKRGKSINELFQESLIYLDELEELEREAKR